MRFFETLAVVALAGSAAASPAVVVRSDAKAPAKKECLCQADVDLVVKHYQDILTLWKPEYKDYIAADGFYDHSESINAIAGVPFGMNIFPNATAFIGYQTYTPDLIPVKIEKVGPFNCKEISFIWSATFTKIPNGTPLGVRGITILDTVKKGGNWLIQSIDVEFSSNYIKNIGGTVTPPTRQ
jgi:hypothetical protein